MKPDPLRERVPAALRLGPMPVAVLARRLSASPAAVRKVLENLLASGDVTSRVVRERKNGRPAVVYGVIA